MESNGNVNSKQEFFKKNAEDYIKNNKLDKLFTNLLNSAVQSNTNEPIVYMV